MERVREMAHERVMESAIVIEAIVERIAMNVQKVSMNHSKTSQNFSVHNVTSLVKTLVVVQVLGAVKNAQMDGINEKMKDVLM